jgi:hypothetical protein
MSPRPTTLKDIAERSESLSDFGRHLRDWLHELRRASSRLQAAAAIVDAPARLSEKFADGKVADAWLAAYAEHLAGRIGLPAPNWAFESWRTSAEPIFDDGGESPALRALALTGAPLAFKRRNIFTPSVDLPLSLRAGRPVKSDEEKRKTNAERQRRFRKARNEELAGLRKLSRQQARLLKSVG